MNVKKILSYFNIENELEDFQKIHQEIEQNIVFKGTNLWILVFAIVIASVGLNTNSPAVIIGAMLISPLMGPINGLGYSVATYNFGLFKRSLKNFTFAVGASLVASTLYFLISPVSSAHSELLARTSPTIYDVLIALFGGLAGIVAISSRLKGNVIPGVAIATALMPPLCTAGYGLGTGQFNYFLGAFYLFTINTVFIALSSVIVSQYFKFPITTIVEPARKRRINQYITFVITLTLAPSIYFGYQLVLQERFQENAVRYINNVSVYEGSYLLKHEINKVKGAIELVYAGNNLNEQMKQTIKQKGADFNINNESIHIEQGFSLNDNQQTELEALKSKLAANANELAFQKRMIDSLKTKPLIGKQLLKEVKPIFTDVQAIAIAEGWLFTEKDSVFQPLAMVVVDGIVETETQIKLRAFLRNRLNQPNLRLQLVNQ